MCCAPAVGHYANLHRRKSLLKLGFGVLPIRAVLYILTIIRDISLRRGLNIIWSPDPGEESAIVGRGMGSGHGAGKTLLCRLLRYCLGEDTFANDDLRRTVAEQLPTGLVGIEVLINAVQWAVLRPIGTTRRQIVRADTTLEELVESTDPSTGIQPLLEALDLLVVPDEGELFIPSSRPHSAWLFALAWLTRDQECRYDHILDWRHARADTRSPVIGTAREQMVVAVRSLIGVLDQEEIRLKDERDSLAEERRSLERDLTYYQRRVEQLRADLSSVLGTLDNAASGGEIELGEWRTQAEARLAREDDGVQVDVLPEILAAEELRQIAPDRITLIRKLQGEPSCEGIVLRGRVTKEEHVPFLVVRRFVALHFANLPLEPHLEQHRSSRKRREFPFERRNFFGCYAE